MGKTIIFNADDFGANSETDSRIFLCFRQGIIKSASAFTNMRWSDSTVQQLKDNPIDLGVHLNHTLGSPVSDPSLVETLVDSRGIFKEDNKNLDLSHINKGELRLEYKSQIERMLEQGIKPTHLDSHRPEIYLNPNLFNICIELASEYSLVLRMPLVNLTDIELSKISNLYNVDLDELFKLSREYEYLAEKAGVHYPARFFNDIPTEDYWTYISSVKSTISRGVAEVCVHLSGDKGKKKMSVLLREELKKSLKLESIRIGNFGDLHFKA